MTSSTKFPSITSTKTHYPCNRLVAMRVFCFRVQGKKLHYMTTFHNSSSTDLHTWQHNMNMGTEAQNRRFFSSFFPYLGSRETHRHFPSKPIKSCVSFGKPRFFPFRCKLVLIPSYTWQHRKIKKANMLRRLELGELNRANKIMQK